MSNGWGTLAGGYEVPRVHRLRDGTRVVSGDISGEDDDGGRGVCDNSVRDILPQARVHQVWANSTSGVVNLAINNGSGAMSLRSTGDAAGMGISCTCEGGGLA